MVETAHGLGVSTTTVSRAPNGDGARDLLTGSARFGALVAGSEQGGQHV